MKKFYGKCGSRKSKFRAGKSSPRKTDVSKILCGGLRICLHIGFAIAIFLLGAAKFLFRKAKKCVCKLWKISSKNKRETFLGGIAAAVFISILYFDSSVSEYNRRSPQETAMLAYMRGKYAVPTRTLTLEETRIIAREAALSAAECGVFLPNDFDGAVSLLAGTAIVESDLRPRFQTRGGDATGLFQIEYGTFRDIRDRILVRKFPLWGREINGRYLRIPEREISFEQIQNDDTLAALYALAKYADRTRSLPPSDDLNAQAKLYKSVYNTELGASSCEKYISKVGSYLCEFETNRVEGKKAAEDSVR